ncbi:hypothetical protein FB567DRAFT_115092 [Paraphoma chrysanthemicola]|uniref:Apple domain-containing protein n=1 Tax=Paraphoma chrysanthemicola TaxID=798071 RepID=A0A8K0VVJ8_9PLEO|nr:hypothetical protein FB567DRAFT_115092 [Paraphoma chrysanthemicola]
MKAEDAPQVVDNAYPEVQRSQAPLEAYSPDYNHAAQPKAAEEVRAYYNDEIGAKHAAQQQTTILGLRRRNFWTLLVIALVLVGVIIGGSVGGVMAVQNSRSTPVSASTPNAPSVPSQFPSATSIPLASASATPSSSSLYIPPPASSVLAIDISCPSILEAYNGKGYRCFKDTDINSIGDITGITAYSLQQCVDACSTMNEVAGTTRCRAVALSQALSDEYGHNRGANCWLKNVTEPRAGRPKLTVAVLNV